MARCDTSCRTSCRRCGDFGSRAERKPDLLNIEVTTGIFRKAFQNFIKRRRALGIEYDRDDIAAADQKLVDWLVETYGGRNPHYESSDEWHGFGIHEQFAEWLPAVADLEGDDLLRAAFKRFVADMEDAYGVLKDTPRWFDPSDGLDEYVETLASIWGAVTAGAPLTEIRGEA